MCLLVNTLFSIFLVLLHLQHYWAFCYSNFQKSKNRVSEFLSFTITLNWYLFIYISEISNLLDIMLAWGKNSRILMSEWYICRSRILVFCFSVLSFLSASGLRYRCSSLFGQFVIPSYNFIASFSHLSAPVYLT